MCVCCITLFSLPACGGQHLQINHLETQSADLSRFRQCIRLINCSNLHSSRILLCTVLKCADQLPVCPELKSYGSPPLLLSLYEYLWLCSGHTQRDTKRERFDLTNTRRALSRRFHPV